RFAVGLWGGWASVVRRDRKAVTWRLRQTHRSRDSRVRHEIREMPPDLVDDLERQPVAAILHGQHDGENLQLPVEARPDRLDRREQLGEPFKRVVLALHWY